MLVTAARTPGELAAMVDRRVSGIPLEYVLGWVEFCGLRVAVEPDVFVPRQRSALVVEQAARLVSAGAVVLDMCCGCGAIGLALATRVPVELHASDVSAGAVQCARRNLVQVSGHVYSGDLFEPVPDSFRGRLDLIVCNAPYVPTAKIGTLPPEARLYEPIVTLDGGVDGLDVVRRVVKESPRWLRSGGHLIVESSESQAADMVAEFGAAGFGAVIARNDAIGATVVVGRCASNPDR